MNGSYNKLKVPIVVMALLSIGLILMILANINLKKQLSNVRESSKNLESNFNVLQENYNFLKAENKAIKEQNALLKQDSASLSSRMKDVEAEIGKAADKLSEFQITVQDSITWFRQNINIESYDNYGLMKKELQSCMHYNNGCRIDLSCINSVNRRNGFKYKLDEDTSKREDFLQDLNKIFSNKGGDCEDFSLLFRAEYNYLLNQCLINYSRKDIIPYTGEKEINRTYMYIVCGTWDPKETVTGWAGHCMVALSKANISTTKDVYSTIKASTLIEPQTGEFKGDMDNTDTITIFSDGQPPNTLHYIYFVITNDDLMIFYAYSDEVKWVGYHDFLGYAKEIGKKVKIS